MVEEGVQKYQAGLQEVCLGNPTSACGIVNAPLTL